MSENRYRRQAFLGPRAQPTFEVCLVGVVGLGGGGSHVVQQLAHIGFLNYVLYDGDKVEDTNLNRLVGATPKDVQRQTPKTVVARRIIRRLQPRAKVRTYPCMWQENAPPLRNCDIIFGCLDSWAARHETEVMARRFLIPYIDIGMTVRPVDGGAPCMCGQVIVSMPGEHCMWCMQFLNEERMSREAARYGVAGERPQVVWANGSLASTAVGIAVDILTGWSGNGSEDRYLAYRGNTGEIERSNRLLAVESGPCPHYPLDSVGEPRSFPQGGG